jgi:hypothetical protein
MGERGNEELRDNQRKTAVPIYGTAVHALVSAAFQCEVATPASKGKMRRQSFFMLITVQPPFFATSMSESLKVPTFDFGP